jgi:hypothetical protein
MKQLQRPNETPDAVLRRLERRPDYHRLVATDEGQQQREAGDGCECISEGCASM